MHLFTHTGIKHDFLYQLLLVSFNSNMMCVASCGLAAYASGAPEFTPLFLGGSCCLVYLVFSVVLCRSVFALLSFLYWTWHCQSFFNLRSAYHFGIFKLFSLIKWNMFLSDDMIHYIQINIYRLLHGIFHIIPFISPRADRLKGWYMNEGW